MTRRPQPPKDPAEDRGDLDALDDLDDLDEVFEVDRPVPIACLWGMPGWCSTGRHHRCYFTTHAQTIKAGTYGHHDGHVWTCPCPCHAHQGYPPCPHPDHAHPEPGTVEAVEVVEVVEVGRASLNGAWHPVQINLF